MNTEKNIQSVKENVQKIITVKNAKRLAALLVVCAIPLSGGAWYQHQQKAAVKAEVEAAKSQMVAQEAQERGINLIGEDKVKELAAARIGTDVNSITFNKIALKDGTKHKNTGEGEAHKDKKDKKDKQHKNHKEKKGNGDDRQDMPREGMGREGMNPQPSAQPMPQPQQTDTNPAALPAQPHVADFIPVYKVKCQVGNVEYKFVINAVNGDVLHTSIDE
ncbi:MAG: hypothetical protein HXM54_03250 [Megasphaera micronuciformis]|nr:hypothetical protein [Megasphaera micronuciformis]